jgi:hypothetical protein
LAFNIHQKKIISSLLPGKFLRYLYVLNKPTAIQIDELKLIYVPIPKAANRSIKEAIAAKIGLNYSISAHKANWKYIPLKSVSENSYYSFSFVRNPLDRLVSCYVQKTKMKNPIHNFWKYGDLISPNMSFANFVDFVCDTPDHLADRHFKSQHLFLLRDDQLIVNSIGKVENLQEDWKNLSKRFNFPIVGHANQSARKDISSYYTTELAKKVMNRYSKDIEVFHYTKEINQFLTTIEKK